MIGPEQKKTRRETRVFLELLGAAVGFAALNYWDAASPRYLLICAALGAPWGIWRAWRPFEAKTFTGIFYAAYMFFTGKKAAEFAYGIDAAEVSYVVLLQGFVVLTAVMIVLEEVLRELLKEPEGIAPR